MGEKRLAKKGKYQTVVSGQVEFYLYNERDVRGHVDRGEVRRSERRRRQK